MMMFNILNAATWGDMAKKKEKGFFDFEFITWRPGPGRQLHFLYS